MEAKTGYFIGQKLGVKVKGRYLKKYILKIWPKIKFIKQSFL